MKLSTFVFGMILFSVGTTIMFAVVQDTIEKNPSPKDPDEWKELAGSYNVFVEDIGLNANSTTRGIIGQTKQGVAESETRDVNLITGALSGGRLALNFYANFDKILAKVKGDTNQYIDPRIINAILALALVFGALVLLHFLRGFKTEV